MLQDLAHTLRTRLAEQGRFVAPKRPQHAFAIEHYAGRVTYSSELLLDKNKVPTCSYGLLQVLELKTTLLSYGEQEAARWPDAACSPRVPACL